MRCMFVSGISETHFLDSTMDAACIKPYPPTVAPRALAGAFLLSFVSSEHIFHSVSFFTTEAFREPERRHYLSAPVPTWKCFPLFLSFVFISLFTDFYKVQLRIVCHYVTVFFTKAYNIKQNKVLRRG